MVISIAFAKLDEVEHCTNASFLFDKAKVSRLAFKLVIAAFRAERLTQRDKERNGNYYDFFFNFAN